MKAQKVQPVYARLEEEQYEWLRRYCFENRVAHAEVIREALEMFREAKEGTTGNRSLTAPRSLKEGKS